MKTKLFILFCAVFCAGTTSYAQPEYVTRHSISKQFVTYGPKTAPPKTSARVSLEPALLAVSCERIKQALFTELGEVERLQLQTPEQDTGKIFLVIHRSADEQVLVTPIAQGKAYNYRVDLPNEIEPRRLVEVITQVVLLERVNRYSPERFTQIPRWASEGFASLLVTDGLETLVLERTMPFAGEKIKPDKIKVTRAKSPNFVPLTFDELSWPENIARENISQFDSSAEFFVRELLRLKNGAECFRQFLLELPQRLNWQVAFLRAFQPHFPQLVSVEKWWGLRIVNIASLENAQQWTMRQSLERLDAALRIPAQIYLGSEEMPRRNDLSPREVIAGWNREQQQLALNKVVLQLNVLRFRSAKNCAPLMDDYRVALENYLEEEQEKGFFKRTFSRNHDEEIRRVTLQKLSTLDTRRNELERKRNEKPREEAMIQAIEVTSQIKAPTSIKR